MIYTRGGEAARFIRTTSSAYNRGNSVVDINGGPERTTFEIVGHEFSRASFQTQHSVLPGMHMLSRSRLEERTDSHKRRRPLPSAASDRQRPDRSARKGPDAATGMSASPDLTGAVVDYVGWPATF
jgi:hypothetical protein